MRVRLGTTVVLSEASVSLSAANHLPSAGRSFAMLRMAVAPKLTTAEAERARES